MRADLTTETGRSALGKRCILVRYEAVGLQPELIHFQGTSDYNHNSPKIRQSSTGHKATRRGSSLAAPLGIAID